MRKFTLENFWTRKTSERERERKRAKRNRSFNTHRKCRGKKNFMHTFSLPLYQLIFIETRIECRRRRRTRFLYLTLTLTFNLLLCAWFFIRIVFGFPFICYCVCLLSFLINFFSSLLLFCVKWASIFLRILFAIIWIPCNYLKKKQIKISMHKKSRRNDFSFFFS